ncbi:MAG: AAA+ family ATPase, partial [Pseudomonadales bacterium]|nr:AAA+ family ATPase [Pseudomonadales bacterium]
GLVLTPEVAREQIDQETGAEPPEPEDTEGEGTSPEPDDDRGDATPGSDLPTRFYGTVELDASRVGRDAGRIAEEVIAHLQGLVGAKVRVTLEIEANIPNGAPENVVRIVTENGRELKFRSQGFEKDQ